MNGGVVSLTPTIILPRAFTSSRLSAVPGSTSELLQPDTDLLAGVAKPIARRQDHKDFHCELPKPPAVALNFETLVARFNQFERI